MFSGRLEGAGVTLPTLLTLLGTVLTAGGNETTNAEPPELMPVVVNQNGPLPGMLYPRESESREVKSLDGMWDFLVSPSGDALKGYRESWFASDLRKVGETLKMPVPSSYNDITTSSKLRDHVGAVWYQRWFFAPASWADKRVFIRFGSVNYLAQVWLNGNLVTNHEIGHLPFEAELTGSLNLGEKNSITVAVDNTLLQTSIPQGQVIEVTTDEGITQQQTYNFDFFNYAGIHRSVHLYTTPKAYVEDILIKTGIVGDTGMVEYTIEVAGLNADQVPKCRVTLLDADGEKAGEEYPEGLSGTIQVPSAKLWWIRDMSTEHGYLYSFQVSLFMDGEEYPTDIYRLPIGIRTITWTNTSVLLNGRPVYLRGFGRHEDSALRGRGLDLVTIARDYELLKWVGANAYRTSHYPYSDEVIQRADEEGFFIIDECPSVNTENFSPALLTRHKQSLSELIRRDKNSPSVLMWSIANEPRTQLPAAEDYFRQVAEHTRAQDPTRPITIALARGVQEDKAGQFLDVISFNRYNAWYSNTGKLDMIRHLVEAEAEAWHVKHNKPVLMSEYGADTMPGLHELPAYVWSEEFQTQLMSKHFEAFDHLRRRGYFMGEFIWNFADFKTAQTYTRVGGNKKGIFTRDRQPKAAAFVVRKRYQSLAAELDNATLPDDLESYISSYYKESLGISDRKLQDKHVMSGPVARTSSTSNTCDQLSIVSLLLSLCLALYNFF